MKTTPFQRWPEIDTLFERVLELEGEARMRFLDDACPDLELRRELLALLEAERRSVGLFDLDGVQGLWDEATTAQADADDRSVVPLPWSIGPYRLLEVLGRGGAATVFKAERADGEFEQEVAFKLLHPTFISEAAQDRFRQERQILASLRHPNVAQLLDGGVTEDGRPFIVMELVEGEPIDVYADRLALGLRERLELFRVACEAVHFAHEKLVVHRDIKPSNVMVTGDGQVKLVDFGIAKLLDPESFAGSPVETRTGVVPMTPAYASPEQILGLSVTTATDIYQLGELAFELLTGRRLQGDDASSLQALRARLDERGLEPLSKVVAPSSLSYGAATDDVPTPLSLVEIARRRSTDPARLRRNLRGDVDRIVRVALRPEPDRRYASAQQLADDVGRYLRHMPISVRRDAIGYRLERFVRRHPWGIPATLVATAVIGVLGVQLYGQYQRTVQERDRADAVITFLTGLFDLADPRGGVGDTLTVRSVLADGATRVERELRDRPLVAATMNEAIGRAYFGLGRFDEAEVLLTQALRTREALLGPDDASVAASFLALADLATEMRDMDEAMRLSEQALDDHTRLFGKRSPRTAAAMAQLAFVLQGRGRRSEARSLYEGALRVLRTEAGPGQEHALDAAAVMTNLAWILIGEGDLEGAARHLDEALAIRTSLLGPNHPSVANTLAALAQLAVARSEPDSAVALSDEILRIRSDHFGARHPSVGDAWMSRAQASRAGGDSGTAERSYREAIAVFGEAYASPSPDLALALNDLGSLLRDQGRLAEAREVTREARDAYREALGPGHPFTGIATHNLAATFEAEGRLADAESGYREAIEIMTRQWPEDHTRVALSRAALGSVLTERGQYDACEDPLREALAALEPMLAPNDWRIGLAQSSLGACLAGAGDHDKADSLLTLGYETVNRALDPSRREVAVVKNRVEAFRRGGAR